MLLAIEPVFLNVLGLTMLQTAPRVGAILSFLMIEYVALIVQAVVGLITLLKRVRGIPPAARTLPMLMKTIISVLYQQDAQVLLILFLDIALQLAKT